MLYGVMVNGVVIDTFKTHEQAEHYILTYYSGYGDVGITRVYD